MNNFGHSIIFRNLVKKKKILIENYLKLTQPFMFMTIIHSKLLVGEFVNILTSNLLSLYIKI